MKMGLGIWAVFLLFSIISCSACLEEERISLLDFKQGLNLTYDYVPLESWRGVNCCVWEGVGCHARTGHVISLDLKDILYTWGEIRGGLFQLPHLEYLDLSFNRFDTLSIPPNVGELRRLKYLSFSGCGFIGQIPTELSELQRLEHLDLSGNDVEGVIPRELGNISALRFLDLSYNEVLQTSKSLEDWITHLRGLESLDLSWSNLTMVGDTILQSIASLANLTTIHIGRNSSLLCESLTASMVGPFMELIKR